MLNVANYSDFTDYHLKELVRLRYIPKEWPADLVNYISQHSFADIIQMASAQCEAPELNTLGNVEMVIPSFSTTELIFDFYRLRNADSIAIIDESRKMFYLSLSELLNQCEFAPQSTEHKLSLMLDIMAKFIHGEPSNNIRLHLSTGEIEVLQ